MYTRSKRLHSYGRGTLEIQAEILQLLLYFTLKLPNLDRNLVVMTHMLVLNPRIGVET